MRLTETWARLMRGHNLLFVVLAFVLTIAAFSSGAGASNKRIITVYADGTTQTVLTEEATVEEALDSAEISLNEKDLVEPTRDTVINSDVFKINVYRARPYTIIDGDKEYDILSAYQSPRLIAEDAGIKTYPEDEFEMDLIENIVATGMVGQRIKIDRAVPVSLVIYGEKTAHRTQATTIGELLEEKGIDLKEGDTVLPRSDANVKAAMSIHIYNSDSMKVVEEPIQFETEKIYDNDLAYGETKIKQKGSMGVRLVAYEFIKVDGKITDRIVRHSVVVEQPVKQIVVVGNKYSGDFAGGVWAQLRQCEAGGDYTRNSGNGYYGAYQFSPSTWMGYVSEEWKNVLPSDAPPNIQDQAALNLYNKSGWAPWPGCRAKLGLP